MRDLTTGSIAGHLVLLAAPLAVSLMTQLAQQLVDLYFVTRLGVAATAGVNAAGNASFLIAAFAQLQSVGATALIAQAIGRRDRHDANLVFNQSLALSAAFGALILFAALSLTPVYLQTLAADEEMVDAGVSFMAFATPAYILLMPTAALGGALRGAGIVKPHLLISVLTVLLNAVLAPFLIAGWGEISGLGVRGAGLATSISVAIGVVAFCWYLRRHEPYLLFDAGLMRPRTHQWRRIFGVGLPAACEFVLVFLSTAVVYYAIRNFGAAVQAGFGIGARALQLLLLPGMALSFAAGPVVAQSFGAARAERVKQTFRIAMLLQGAVSLVITLWIQWRARVVADVFQVDAEVVGVAAVFLQIVSWNMVAQGVVYVCSSTFQGLGNTIPSLVSSSVRFAIFTISVAWLAARSTFAVEQVWYVLIVSVTAQALLSLWLVRGELRRRLVLPLRTPQASAVPSHQRTVMR